MTEVPLSYGRRREDDDVVMADEEGAGSGRRVRGFRSVSEKRRIAELTFEPGASVALVARAHGVNANQVFKWRRLLKRGELNEPAVAPTSLLQVMLNSKQQTGVHPPEAAKWLRISQ